MEVIGTERDLAKGERTLLLKRRLQRFLRRVAPAYRLTARQATEVGLAYTHQAVNAGELGCALGRCTRRQQRILALWLGSGLPQAEAARLLGVSLATVKRDAAEALERMAAQVWQD